MIRAIGGGPSDDVGTGHGPPPPAGRAVTRSSASEPAASEGESRGTPGVGGFLYQEYNSLIYEHMLLCIATIGLVGFALDRLMNVAEMRLRAA